MTGISDFTEKNPSSKVSSFSFGVIGSIKMITITNNSSFAWLILEAGRRKPCLVSARKIRSSLLEMFRKISISENFAKLIGQKCVGVSFQYNFKSPACNFTKKDTGKGTKISWNKVKKSS